MRIKFENDILDADKRKIILQDIMSPENRLRKMDSYKRHQCYKDKTSDYVVEHLLAQFDFDTVIEMRYAISNISFMRKIVDKLARVYSNGVQRTGSPADTDKIQAIEKKTNLNSEMKTANRILKAQRNVALFVKPCPRYNEDGSQVEWSVALEALAPYLYDVIEDPYDRTQAMVHILSNYDAPTSPAQALEARVRPKLVALGADIVSPQGDKSDQTIANNPIDAGMGPKKQFIWWSKNYHFTTDENGVIIADPTNADNKNPFECKMFVDLSVDQDGTYWADGGKDLVDGAILINALISHINHVGVTQGYGQFYATGENLPRSFKVGPNKAIIAEYKKDTQAEPKFGFLNANPQLADLRSLVEMYIALLLTSNNLSTSGVASSLGSNFNAASGIAIIIDKAESLEDVQDQRQIFLDAEPKIFEAINAFLATYSEELCDGLKDLELSENFEDEFNIRFNDQTPIMTEAEKLANLKTRKDLGIDSMIGLLMKEDPSLSEKQAEEKFRVLLEQQITEEMLRTEIRTEMGAPVVIDPNAVDDQGNPIVDPNADPNAPPEKAPAVIPPKGAKPAAQNIPPKKSNAPVPPVKKKAKNKNGQNNGK